MTGGGCVGVFGRSPDEFVGLDPEIVFCRPDDGHPDTDGRVLALVVEEQRAAVRERG